MVDPTIRILPIAFARIRDYWVRSGHFAGSDSKLGEYVCQLGPFLSDFRYPPYRAFGLFCDDQLMGVTMMVHWSQKWVRYRTLNLERAVRGRGLAFHLLLEAHYCSWPELDIFGWARRSHVDWCRRRGFEEVDGVWHGDHLAMVLSVDRISEFRKYDRA